MSIPMTVCKRHEQAHRVTEQCPYCEPVYDTSPWRSEHENRCPECAIQHYTYPGYMAICPLCGGD